MLQRFLRWRRTWDGEVYESRTEMLLARMMFNQAGFFAKLELRCWAGRDHKKQAILRLTDDAVGKVLHLGQVDRDPFASMSPDQAAFTLAIIEACMADPHQPLNEDATAREMASSIAAPRAQGEVDVHYGEGGQ